MKVGSQLEDAQLEITDDAGESTTVGMIKYNNVQDSISVGNGTITKRVFPVEGDFGAFRSAMYPVGSMINSFLTDAQFIAEMDDKWVNVNTLESATGFNSGVHFKIAKSTDLGAYLDAAGASDDPGDSNYVTWVNPAGKYLRAGGSWSSGAGASGEVFNGDKIISDNKTHIHGVARTLYTYNSGSSIHYEWGLGGLFYTETNTSSTHTAEYMRNTDSAGLYPTEPVGINESRPESAVCNLFIKVNN